MTYCFHGTGRDLPLKETIRSFKELIEGQHDDLREQAFLLSAASMMSSKKRRRSAANSAGRVLKVPGRIKRASFRRETHVPHPG